jgi:hypothetical protein
MNSDREYKLSANADEPSSSSSQSSEEVRPALAHAFATWSNEEIAALRLIDLDTYHQGMINNLIVIMNEWVHQHLTGWYQTQNKKLEIITEASENKLHPTEIQLGLKRYLETANKLKKPKAGQVERLLLPTSHKYVEKFVNVYRNFWHECAYATFYNYLLKVSRLPDEAFRNDKGKIYIYALLKFRNQTRLTLQIKAEDSKQLLIDIDKVISGILAKANLERNFLLSEANVYASPDIMHEIMPRYFKLLDLCREFESSPALARYVHVRPTVLIQFAQLIEYIYKLFSDDATEKTTLFRKKYTVLDKAKAKKVLNMLDVKRHEIATAMAFHEQLQLSHGIPDLIEVLQSIVDNKSVKLLPTATFFQYDSRQIFSMGEFSASDLDAPKYIDPKDHSAWRRDYIAKHKPEVPEITPIIEHEVNVWLNEQANIKDVNMRNNEKNIIQTHLLRIVSEKNMEQHNLFLVSKPVTDATVFKIEKYNNAYIFVKTPPRIIYMKDGVAKAVEIKSMKLFNDLIKSVKIKDESRPFQNVIDKLRLGVFRKLIVLAEEHMHLEITKISAPTTAAHTLFESPQGVAASAASNPLASNRFFSGQQNETNELHDFFITHADDRKPFLKINDDIKKGTLDFMLRQVAHNTHISALFSPQTRLLNRSPEGPVNNFMALTAALNTFGSACNQELLLATQARQRSKNNAHRVALGNYIETIELKRDQFRVNATSILSYWIDQVKDIYPLPFRGMTDFHRLLKDAVIALGNQEMLHHFNERIYGAIALDDKEEKKHRPAHK